MISSVTRSNNALMPIAEKKKSIVVYGSWLMISLVWLGMIFAAPWLMAQNYPLSALSLYQIFSVICHQIPDRTFFLWGFPLAVCSRCAGIYAGFIGGLILYPLARDLSNERFPPRRWLVGAATPMMIDFAVGYVGLWPSSFLSRTVTGFLFGAGAAFFILPGFIATFSGWRREIKNAES
jgi:uncharacterized membrane protein